ncbi:ATP-dependent Clp protease ATP-binding subunit [candidate division WWE3 bacterium]|nr:ATP-dependent Clp protease ATP-binding subunit [candidate division WWE3 bacterium]
MAAKQEVLNLERFSGAARNLLRDALIIASEAEHKSYVSFEHLLLAILQSTDANAYRLLVDAGCEPERLRATIRATAVRTPQVNGVLLTHGELSLPLSTDAARIIERSREAASKFSAAKIGSDHLLLAMFEVDESRIVLVAAGVRVETIKSLVLEIHQSGHTEKGDAAIIGLEELGTQAGQLEPIINVTIVDALWTLWTHRRLPGVLLFAESGAPAWDQILGLVRRLSSTKEPKFSLIAISPDAYLSNPILTIQAAIRRALDEKAILILPDIGQYVGQVEDGFTTAVSLVREAVQNSGLKIVGIAEPAYRSVLSKDRLFSRMRFTDVEATTIDQTIAYITRLIETLVDGRITFAEDTLKQIVELADQYLPRELPGCAIDLTYDVVAAAELVFDQQQTESVQIDGNLVLAVLERLTNLPLGKLIGTEKERLAQMEEIIHRRYVNQKDAVTALARSIRRSRTAFRDKRRPIGTFLFLGTTGTGKTELTKALAEFLFGSDEALVGIDMNEFAEPHTVSALLGSPVGYEGHSQSTPLDVVAQRPFMVVRFDEIEKAHDDVLLALLGLMENGYITTRSGRRINFRHTVVIMTSNVGSEYLRGEDPGSEKDQALAALKDRFRPEFLNRVDRTIVFSPFSSDDLQKVAGMFLASTVKEAAEEGINLVVAATTLQQLVANMAQECKQYGARPLRRVIDVLEEVIVDGIVAGIFKPGQTVEVRFMDNKLEPVIVSDTSEEGADHV